MCAGKPSIEGRKELEADPTNAAPVNSGSMGTGELLVPLAGAPGQLHGSVAHGRRWFGHSRGAAAKLHLVFS